VIDPSVVAVARDAEAAGYPDRAPFHPSEAFPEYPFRSELSGDANRCYGLVRQAFQLLGLDVAGYGSPQWNPLSEIIRPGDTVLIKPNLVRHFHGRGSDLRSVVTHGSMVRAVLDYVHLALGDSGRVVVGDAPLQTASFPALVAACGLRELQQFYGGHGRRVEIVDFRREEAQLNRRREWTTKRELQGDPAGYRAVDLGPRSLLSPLGGQSGRFRVTDYQPGVMAAHHNEETHEYLIPRSVLDADVVISLPKMKTHRKVGITAALKNLVGINGHKDWLPHHRSGATGEGGDEYLHPSFWKRVGGRISEREDTARSHRVREAYRLANRVVGRAIRHSGQDAYMEGSWYGNDTLWRTVLDLNRVLLYADRQGRLHDGVQRNLLVLVDGLIAGDGEGPLEPRERRCGLVIAGTRAVEVDTVVAGLMGFDFLKIPLIREGWSVRDYPVCGGELDALTVRSNVPQWAGLAAGQAVDHLDFMPPSGWKGHIELDAVARRPPATAALAVG